MSKIELKRRNVHRIVLSKEEAAKLLSDGFEVVEDKDNLMELDKEPKEVDYDSMTTDQLKALCKNNGLEGYTTLNKEDLIKFIKENVK